MFLSVLDVDAPLWLSYLLTLQVVDAVVGVDCVNRADA